MSSKKAADGAKREVSVSGMSFLRGSANYVWCTTSVLGKGATGAVFQGVNRHSGEAVAVKTFNQMSHMRPQEVQMREFEVLKKVNHRNIVKLLAIEEEQESRGKVIVMELCTGGSLFNILDDPENSHGLEEKEFLLVLHHLASGMKHLRDNNLVHRDLKPGNIMKYVGLDGSTQYKLTDFGAARELEDEEQFMSLYGTEEYLHPDMYERAVLRKTAGKSFGANVDLWSIGVTLYHVATGLLPFRPHGGRRNKETMYKITTEKQPGVISGVQTTENGPIEWSRDLPPTCQLSLGLRKLVTPLLGGLLEVDPNKMWSFEKFFSEVTGLLARKKVYIFFVNKVQPLTVYMQPDHKYDQLTWLIQEQTDVNTKHQLLIYNNSIFSKLLHRVDESHASSFPNTTQESPVMLFNTNNEDVCLTLPKTPSLKFPSFPNAVSVDQDALTGKSICSVGHAISRVIQHQALCVSLIYAAVDAFTKVLVSEVKEMANAYDALSQDTRNCSESFAQLVTHHRRFLTICLLNCPSPATPIDECGNNAALVVNDVEEDGKIKDRSNERKAAACETNSNNNTSDVASVACIREQLEDTVNNVVEEEKRVRQSLEKLSNISNILKSEVLNNGLLEQTWHKHVSAINEACDITTVPPGKSKSSVIGHIPPPAPLLSLTPASMMTGGYHGSGIITGDSAVTAMSKTPAIAATLVSKLKDSWQHLLRDRAARSLTFNDEQFHLLEKLKMKETAKSLECLKEGCSKTIHTAADALADWCKVAQVQKVHADIATSDLNKHSSQLKLLQQELRTTQDSYHSLANRLLNKVKDSSIALQDSSSASYGRCYDEQGAVDNSSRLSGSAFTLDGNKSKSIQATVRNLQRITEKQEATFRLFDEARTLTAAITQAVALYRPLQPPH